MIAHAGLVAQRLGGRWWGVLIEGPSGSGKSDLTLRMLDQGFRLVADDRVLLWTVQGQLFGRAPDVLQGLIEVRGLDVMGETALALCEVRLAIRPGAPERLAEPEFTQYLGVRLPSLALRYLDASAPAKLRRAIGALYLANQRRM